jgi:hypothetical protein
LNRVLLFARDDGEFLVWDVSTASLRDEAYLDLFRQVEGHVLDAYGVAHAQIRDMARRGNPEYARAFIEVHSTAIWGSARELPVFPYQPRPDLPVRRVDVPEALSDSNLPREGT